MLWRGPTIKKILSEHNDVGPGFDLLRLGLAAVIFNAHAGAIFNLRSSGDIVIAACATATDAGAGWKSWREPIYLTLVPLFFALSGFLVAGSALRTQNIKTFMIFRGLRIVPALAVEVTLSALVLGLVFTRLDRVAYLTSPGLIRYFGNIVGSVQFYLPGVFEQSPVRGVVNNSLWTLPAEFDCYLTVVVLMLSSILYDRKKYSILFGVVTLGAIALSFKVQALPGHGNFPVWAIIYCFFCGVFVFHWRDRVVVPKLAVVVAAFAVYVAIYIRVPLIVCAIAIAYLAIAIGMIKMPKVPLLAKNDYSYGIYLYGFPITQAVREILAGATQSQFVLRGAAFVATVIFAAVSWHLVEQRALKQKKRFVSGSIQVRGALGHQ